MILLEVTIRAFASSREAAEELSLAGRTLQSCKRRPCGVVVVAGFGVRPLPAGSKIEMDAGPSWVAFDQFSAQPRRRDDPDIERICEHGDRGERTDASPAIPEADPLRAVKQECDDTGLLVEFTVECDWALRECAKAAVDGTAPRPN
ncbi:hypothetical protein AMR74_15315 [Halorubrum tropicale]|uniref:Uncharacterized protein n=1 Tax=Halorubrum tropicale TaxID=1765655 RepID=A0A0M9AN38_9EURY|nr:hypothetical protein AMR74_15315 [Halorubrum tropicale]